MKKTTPKLNDASLDGFIIRWLAGGSAEDERKDWERALVFDARLREELCDWIKTLREPEWSRSFKENEK